MLFRSPESAGSKPGPACYGLGGTKATVTDANLLLGRLRPESFMGGEFQLDYAAAKKAIDQISLQLALTNDEVRSEERRGGKEGRAVAVTRQ